LQARARITVIVTGRKIFVKLGRGTLAFSTRHFCRKKGTTAVQQQDDQVMIQVAAQDRGGMTEPTH